MADEITVRFSARVLNGNMDESFGPGQITIDQSVQGQGGHVQEIGLTEEALDVGDIGVGTINTEGCLYLHNLDATNYITYGPQVGTGSMEAMGKLKAGEIAWLRLSPGVVVLAQADTAACKLDVRLYAD